MPTETIYLTSVGVLRDQSCQVEAVKLRNFIKHLLPKHKADYYNEVIEADKSDPTKFWRHMNTLLDKNAPTRISIVKEPGSDSLLDESESANCLNDYYVSVAAKLTAYRKNFVK